MNESDSRLAAGRLKFLTIVAIAVVPIIVAYLLFYYFREWVPSETTNEGHLILPPLQVERITDSTGNPIPTGKWAMLIVIGADCTGSCEDLIYLAGQVHKGLGKDSGRVSRYLLIGGSEISPSLDKRLGREYPDMEVRYYSPAALGAVFGEVVDEPLAGRYLFLMDPNGNIMMYYTTELAGKPMLKDIKHLLRISTIG